MAFANTKGRYASFGIVSSLPPEIIDVFWEILDQNLKDVFLLDDLLTFQLINNKGQLSFKYYDKYSDTAIILDYAAKFDPFYPDIVQIIDNNGRETIILPHEKEIDL
ncbi:DUF960 domain-containing protein [Streptococcus macacae]|uniref:DUF960 domain-containing protein n=1 Tax=Streptococcus macacae NCTC 11558 TaxID=764298 RepID=G5JWS9_9STRE|nr:DUF960 domain-containing protein [Streptococcus macacae]EHJ53298.1 hypothetical protein STRMA_1216 [Streptococcus macacae NCTC 11558]SUN79037.1 Staphylococcal protein of uncharacterised function (DUF960) [Streptococcus macacae NCTC 11558]